MPAGLLQDYAYCTGMMAHRLAMNYAASHRYRHLRQAKEDQHDVQIDAGDLPLARELMQIQGGSLTIHSAPAQGCLARAWLPAPT